MTPEIANTILIAYVAIIPVVTVYIVSDMQTHSASNVMLAVFVAVFSPLLYPTAVIFQAVQSRHGKS